jgi:hypothetical protein
MLTKLATNLPEGPMDPSDEGGRNGGLVIEAINILGVETAQEALVVADLDEPGELRRRREVRAMLLVGSEGGKRYKKLGIVSPAGREQKSVPMR